MLAFQVFVVTCLVSLIINCLCMLYCVFVILVLGEISGDKRGPNAAGIDPWKQVPYQNLRTQLYPFSTGPEEVDLLNTRMGTSLSGSLPLFALSIIIWGCKTFLFQEDDALPLSCERCFGQKIRVPEISALTVAPAQASRRSFTDLPPCLPPFFPPSFFFPPSPPPSLPSSLSPSPVLRSLRSLPSFLPPSLPPSSSISL